MRIAAMIVFLVALLLVVDRPPAIKDAKVTDSAWPALMRTYTVALWMHAISIAVLAAAALITAVGWP